MSDLIEEAATLPAQTPLDIVFVYGSLKRGFGNHRVVRGARFLGVGQTPPRFDLIDLGAFPAAIPGKHMLTGELYEVDQDTMERLDVLESNGELYQRKKIPVLMHGQQIPAWIYLFLCDDGMDPLVEPVGNRVTWENG